MKDNKQSWKKAEPIEKFYVKYDPHNNIPNNEDTINNQIEKEVKALASAVYVTNKDKQNLTTSHKEILLWRFRLGHIGLQHAEWLICTGSLKMQGNSKAVALKTMLL